MDKERVFNQHFYDIDIMVLKITITSPSIYLNFILYIYKEKKANVFATAMYS